LLREHFFRRLLFSLVKKLAAVVLEANQAVAGLELIFSEATEDHLLSDGLFQVIFAYPRSVDSTRPIGGVLCPKPNSVRCDHLKWILAPLHLDLGDYALDRCVGHYAFLIVATGTQDQHCRTEKQSSHWRVAEKSHWH
jgi:hypothetical protein